MNKKIDYSKIIDKYITNTLTKKIYLIHVTLVTQRALRIARGLNLPAETIQFIEEASMLHDIGIAMVDDIDLGCTGKLEYICHGTKGREILESEGLPKHALVAERHTGVGIPVENIIKENLPLPHRDMLAESLEEKIISWADLFYSKNPDDLFRERSIERAFESIAKYGENQQKIFREWESMFAKYH